MKGIVLPAREEDFTADPVELFYDLAYVFAFSQLVAWLVHHPTWTGAAEAGLLFTLIWFTWSWFTWSANAVSGNGRAVRFVILVATAITVPLAASIEKAYEDTGLVFGASTAALMVMVIALTLVTHDPSSEEFRSSLRLALPNFVVIALLIGGGLLENEARVVAWALAIAIIVAATIAAGSGTWLVRIGHFTERHGLIFIIALGEVIVALGISFVKASEDGELSSSTSIGLVASGIFAGLLWWSYFDRFSPALEHKGSELEGNPLSRFVRDVFTYGHFLIIGGVIAAAAALEEALLHPDDPLPLEFRTMLAVGLSMFWFGVILSIYRAFRLVPIERLIAIIALCSALAFASSVPAVWLVVILDVILIVALVFEHQRVERMSQAAS